MSRKKVIAIAPGRGSYTKDTLGYLERHGGSIRPWIEEMDEARRASEWPSLTEMDRAKVFKTALHTKGEHASALIYACALADFHRLSRDQNEVIAVTGNSMGWYIALVLSGVLSPMDGYKLIQSMGSMMTGGLVGGQVIYPIVDENWRIDASKRSQVLEVVEGLNQEDDFQVYVSIELGGYLVFGANKPALPALLKALPQEGDFPFQLINHGAFHTPLLESVSKKAFETLSPEMFQRPQIPLIDGRGKIWQPYSADPYEIYQYTLGHQVVKPYHFTRSVETGLKEWAPDQLVLLGPGNSLGGSIGQILVNLDWQKIESKDRFSQRQKSESPILVSMGLE